MRLLICLKIKLKVLKYDKIAKINQNKSHKSPLLPKRLKCKLLKYNKDKLKI